MMPYNNTTGTGNYSDEIVGGLRLLVQYTVNATARKGCSLDFQVYAGKSHMKNLQDFTF
jgi:hypothetical protein